MVSTTLKLGISILNGGNSEVQRVCPFNINTYNYKFGDTSKEDPLLNYPYLLTENAGVLKGQEGCGLLFECPGIDADLLVSFQILNKSVNVVYNF